MILKEFLKEAGTEKNLASLILFLSEQAAEVKKGFLLTCSNTAACGTQNIFGEDQKPLDKAVGQDAFGRRRQRYRQGAMAARLLLRGQAQRHPFLAAQPKDGRTCAMTSGRSPPPSPGHPLPAGQEPPQPRHGRGVEHHEGPRNGPHPTRRYPASAPSRQRLPGQYSGQQGKRRCPAPPHARTQATSRTPGPTGRQGA